MHDHLSIENLNAQFVSIGSEPPLALAVRSLSAALSHEGLEAVVSALLPEEPLQVEIVDQPGPGCVIRIQAARFGFNPKLRVWLQPSTTTNGGILINVDPVSQWSPLDRVMLAIAHRNLDKLAASQPGISRTGSGRYQLDLQGMIRDRLLASSAPVRWDTSLERIDGSQRQIRVEFVPSIDA